MKAMNNQMNNNNPMTPNGMIKKIREYDFAIIETVLFLDTHPNNLKALRYYSKLRTEREKLVAEYEKKIGPISMYGNMSENEWSWIEGPWPWEGDC